jgi:hypothetical protein
MNWPQFVQHTWYLASDGFKTQNSEVHIKKTNFHPQQDRVMKQRYQPVLHHAAAVAVIYLKKNVIKLNVTA